MSGGQREQKRIVRHYLHRWLSWRSMKRHDSEVEALTGRNRVGMELKA